MFFNLPMIWTVTQWNDLRLSACLLRRVRIWCSDEKLVSTRGLEITSRKEMELV